MDRAEHADGDEEQCEFDKHCHRGVEDGGSVSGLSRTGWSICYSSYQEEGHNVVLRLGPSFMILLRVLLTLKKETISSGEISH